VGPSQSTFAEFNPLFTTNGMHLYASGLLGSRDTLSDQLALVGVHNNLSFNLAHSHADTDGFGSNKDFRQDANGALIQAALSERLNIQVEADTSATDRGDHTSAPRYRNTERATAGETLPACDHDAFFTNTRA